MTVLVSAAFLPETKGVSLEDLDGVFKKSPWEVMAHKRAHERRHRKQRPSPSESAVRFEDIEMVVTNVPSQSPEIDSRDCV